MERGYEMLTDEPFDIVYPDSPSESPESYILRINQAGLSVVQFVQLFMVLQLEEMENNPDDEKGTANDFYRAVTAASFRHGVVPYPDIDDLDFDRLVYDIVYSMDVIAGFMVTQKRDLELREHKLLLVELINMVEGPLILPQNTFGLGLFADQDYSAGEFICEYGGVKCNHDFNVSLKPGYEMARFGRRYNISLHFKGDGVPVPGEDWIIDGELFFTLTEKGRWANTVLVNGDENAEYELGPGPELPHPSVRFIQLKAIREIRKGEFINVNYGDTYPREFFLEVPKEKTLEEQKYQREAERKENTKARRRENQPFVLPFFQEEEEEEDNFRPGDKRKNMAKCITCNTAFAEDQIIYACQDCGEQFCSHAHSEHECMLNDPLVVKLVEKRNTSRSKKGKGRKSYPSKSKAKRILKEGKINGKRLSAKQKRFFGWVAGGRK